MPWIFLLIAGVFEIGFASSLKLTEGFSRPGPTAFFLVCMICSFVFLERAAQSLPIGTAYAVWTGIGSAGTIIIGILYYHEPATALRLFFLCTLVGSIIGLKVVSAH